LPVIRVLWSGAGGLVLVLLARFAGSARIRGRCGAQRRRTGVVVRERLGGKGGRTVGSPRFTGPVTDIRDGAGVLGRRVRERWTCAWVGV